MEKKIWFRRKRYGLGWFPVTWEGWLTILLYVTSIITLAFINKKPNKHDLPPSFFIPLIVITIIFLFICYKKGDPLRWHWGDKGENKKD